jgi:triacylglycerol lipase
MSSRRRAALLGALLAVVLAVAGVVVARSVGHGVEQDRPGTVLLVPGYGGDTGSVEPLAAALRAAGRDVRVVEVGDGTGDLRGQAEQVAAASAAALASGAPSVDVVGYSAGGVVARVWAADLGGGQQARRVVTLGSPHHGTTVAGLGALLATPACPPACRQLAEGSDLLSGLPETPGGPVWTSVWTTDDEVVTPPDSAVLAGAVDVELQAVCPGATVAHGALPGDPLVVGIVLDALAVPPLEAAPGAADCGRLRAAGAAALSS